MNRIWNTLRKRLIDITWKLIVCWAGHSIQIHLLLPQLFKSPTLGSRLFLPLTPFLRLVIFLMDPIIRYYVSVPHCCLPNRWLPGRVDGKLICNCRVRIDGCWWSFGGDKSHEFVNTSCNEIRFVGSFSTICFTSFTALGLMEFHSAELKSIEPFLCDEVLELIQSIHQNLSCVRTSIRRVTHQQDIKKNTQRIYITGTWILKFLKIRPIFGMYRNDLRSNVSRSTNDFVWYFNFYILNIAASKISQLHSRIWFFGFKNDILWLYIQM